MVICAALVVTSQVPDFMLTGYLPTYLKVVVHVGNTAGLVMIVATLAILMAAVVFVAMLSDRIGVKPIMWTGCGLLVVASVPAFLLMRFGGYLSGGLHRCAADRADGTVFRQHHARCAAGAVPDQGAQRSAGHLVQHRAIDRRRNHPADRSSADIWHRQRNGAGLHADLCGPGGDDHPLFMPEVAGKPLPGSGPSVESEEAGELAGA